MPTFIQYGISLTFRWMTEKDSLFPIIHSFPTKKRKKRKDCFAAPKSLQFTSHAKLWIRGKESYKSNPSFNIVTWLTSLYEKTSTQHPPTHKKKNIKKICTSLKMFKTQVLLGTGKNCITEIKDKITLVTMNTMFTNLPCPWRAKKKNAFPWRQKTSEISVKGRIRLTVKRKLHRPKCSNFWVQRAP